MYIKVTYNDAREDGEEMSTTQGRPKMVRKHQRFNARLTEEQKRLFERAAALYGQSVSQFVMSSAQRAAEQAIREHEVIRLSERDSRAVMEALLHPAPAGPALRKAADRYHALVRDTNDIGEDESE
jgi:uncharacterized protein (DUF1778 family)